MPDVVGWRSEIADRLMDGPTRVRRTAICARTDGERCASAPTANCRCGIRVVKRLDYVTFALSGMRDRYPHNEPETGDLYTKAWPQFGPRSALIKVRGSGTLLDGRGDPPETVRCERIVGASPIAYLLDGYQEPVLQQELTECGWTVRWLFRPPGTLSKVVPVEWIEK